MNCNGTTGRRVSAGAMSKGSWQHPWLRIELAIRAVLADRLTRGPSAKVDQVLMARVKERERIEHAGWFN